MSTPRPEFERPPIDASHIGDIERPLPLGERILRNDAVQRIAIILLLIAAWEAYARWLDYALLFPTFTETIRVAWTDFGELSMRIAATMRALLIGYTAGLACAAVLTTLAVASDFGARFL